MVGGLLGVWMGWDGIGGGCSVSVGCGYNKMCRLLELELEFGMWMDNYILAQKILLSKVFSHSCEPIHFHRTPLDL